MAPGPARSSTGGLRIRTAREEDLGELPGIEREAGTLRAIGMNTVADDEPPTIDELRPYLERGRAWVAVDEADNPIGYLILDVVDNNAHIEQVSVLPHWSRRGIGRALIERGLAWASERGFAVVTLTTFTDVPWNGPYYEGLNFEYIPAGEVGPELGAIRVEEARKGLDAWPRACMRRIM